MSVMERVATASCRAWTALYTWRLPEEVRDRRRAEIESDMWEQRSNAGQASEVAADTGFEILTRVLFGMSEDLSWRYDVKRTSGSDIQSSGGKNMFVKLFAAIATVLSIFAGVFLIYIGVGRTADGPEEFAWPLAAGLALLVGVVVAHWSLRVGTTLVALGSLTVVFMWPWMAGGLIPLALVVIFGTLTRGWGINPRGGTA